MCNNRGRDNRQSCYLSEMEGKSRESRDLCGVCKAGFDLTRSLSLLPLSSPLAWVICRPLDLSCLLLSGPSPSLLPSCLLLPFVPPPALLLPDRPLSPLTFVPPLARSASPLTFRASSCPPLAFLWPLLTSWDSLCPSPAGFTVGTSQKRHLGKTFSLKAGSS